MRSPTKNLYRNTLLRRTLIAAACAASLAACGEQVEPLGDGELAVSWEVSPHGCEAAGVEMVEVRLENAHRAYDDSFACQQGEAFLDQLSPANYDLTLVGIDNTGRETFISQRELVTINAEKVREAPHVRLTARPASVEVGWRFSNGRVCGANGVSDVEVTIYDQAFYEMAHTGFGCNAGAGTIEGLTAGDYIVEAVGRADEENFRGIEEVTLKRGEHVGVDVELELDD